MRLAGLLGVFVAAFVAIHSAAWAEEGRNKQADLDWAKSVAVDFLDAVVAGDADEGRRLMTKDRGATPEEQTAAAERVASVNHSLPGPVAFRIADESISPDQDEAAFRGVFDGQGESATFSLRVVKETDGGKWRVAFFRFSLVSKPASK